MKKLAIVIAGLATLAVAAPRVASAESFGIRIGGDRHMHRHYHDHDFRGPRAEYYRHDRGLHRGWYKHRGEGTVIIKKRRHWD